MKKIFPKLLDAITCATSLTDESEDRDTSEKTYRIDKKMYIVYYYLDLEKGGVGLHHAFDSKTKALKFASELSEGKDSEVQYACHSGEFFDQRAKNRTYKRIAVDPVSKLLFPNIAIGDVFIENTTLDFIHIIIERLSSKKTETNMGLSNWFNYIKEEEKIVQEAFNRDFQDPIQASGTGKSKLLMNFAESEDPQHFFSMVDLCGIVNTSMPTERVLAEASSRIINDPDVDLPELINQFSSALKKGIVEVGHREELTTRLLLLITWMIAFKRIIHVAEMLAMSFVTGTYQVTECKNQIENGLKDNQVDYNETRDKFIKKIRINDNADVSDTEIIAFREHFQIPFALFGLSSKIYNCLKHNKSVDEKPEKVKIIKRMEPLVYKME
ncbi:8349_t:CDS:2 [Diversispora eburnea]|uniref:8349_t:CDS:1 n=1 Tax=Diversispora eburnea TaxID=1213867 RepID=A0A9N8W0U6_9GLOM|nr:8349_t:CDS:2 [Diversispora eburnea]